jgi:tetratricopeptide (TPR) repeat protein
VEKNRNPEGDKMRFYHQIIAALIVCLPLSASGCAAENDYKKGVEALDKQDYDQAIRRLTKVVENDPKNADAWNARGFAYQQKKEFDKAIGDFNQAVRWDPKHALAFNNRGNTYLEKKNYRKALADYNQAIRLEPKDIEYLNNRGICYRRMGQYQKAMADHRHAIRLDPKHPNGYNCLAWLWSVSPKKEVRDCKKAVEYAEKACKLSNWKNPYYLDTLAAAYAEAGDFKNAVKFQEKALTNQEFVDRYGKAAKIRVKQYKAKKPYRENK